MLLFLLMILLGASLVAQHKHLQVLGGYNLVATKGAYSYERLKGLEHGIRLNTHYYVSRKQLAPYISFDALAFRRVRESAWTSHGGYPDRITRDYRSYDIISDIGFGASVRKNPHSYWNFGIGLQGIGFFYSQGYKKSK